MFSAPQHLLPPFRSKSALIMPSSLLKNTKATLEDAVACVLPEVEASAAANSGGLPEATSASSAKDKAKLTGNSFKAIKTIFDKEDPKLDRTGRGRIGLFIISWPVEFA